MPPARAARRVPAPTTPAARVRAPAPAQPAHRPSRGEPLSAAGPAVRLTPAKTARPTAVPAIGGGGDPLPGPVRLQLEKSLRVDLRAVRVHTDAHAHELAKSLSARAVTYGNHIFLGEGEQPTDIALVGHEVAHVVQQRAAPRLQAWNRSHTDSYEREAHQTADAVARRQQFTVHERTTGPRVQRLGISDVLDYFADKANIIPGFRMFTIILGVNPINMSSVDRSAANILRALIEFIPGGGLVTQALDNYGIFDKIGAWIEQQVAALGMVGSSFRQAIDDFLDSLSWTDIFHLGDVWDRAKRIFTAPIDRLISFAKGVITDILKFIKEAILKPLAALAEGTPAYDLLKAVLGEDPITGEPVAQDADALIGGFMKLIGQEEIYNNIKKANALSRAWAWFKGALSGLLGFVRQIPGLFIAALQSLELFDVVLPPRAFVKIARVFAGFFGQFVSWAGGQILSLLQIIFEVVAPGAVPYVKKAAGAFKTIIQNPIGFIGNLVKAGKQGFQQFASRFLTHLKKSLIDWLTGTLSGADIYIPQSFEFLELLKFVLSVLGLTWQNIRQKLVKAIGETAVKALETGFEIVVTLITKGPAAAWQQIKEGLTNLKEMAMDAIMDYVKSKVVEEAVKKLISFLSPVGAFIQAIIAIYNTIMFFVERLKQIARVAMAFIDSIAAIAAGSIGAAANKVEQTMAGFLTLVISFLARFAGLGKVSDAVVKLLNKIRAPIDKALDKVVAWIVAMAKKLGKFIAQAGVPQDPKERLRLGRQAALAIVNRFARRPVTNAVLVPLLAGVRTRYGFARLEVVPKQGRWWVIGRINPEFDAATESLTPESVASAGAGEGRALLVGEGNFSFALSIAVKTQIGGRLVATDFVVDQRKTLKQSAAAQAREAESTQLVQENVSALEAMGVQVIRQVDATNPSAYPEGSFDIVVFNHPFTVTKDEKGKTVRFGEKANILLIEAFLAVAKQKIREGGQIVIISSLARLQRWKLDEIAAKLDLEQTVLHFLATDFPGYRHEKTLSGESAATVTTTEQFAVVFTIKAHKGA
jgi:hypothetical protein